MIERIHTLQNLTHWRRNALLFALGVCGTLTQPPFFLFPLLVVAYSGLLLMLQRSNSARRAFWDGFFFGWGYFVTGLYWFAIALLTDASKFGWMIPFAVFGLTAVIALYYAFASWVYFKIAARGFGGVVSFALVWTLFEFARGHLFTGFPWNLPGYAWMFSDAVAQQASLFGVYGLSFMTLLLAASPLLLLQRNKAGFTAIITVFIVLSAWGYWRLETATFEAVEGVRVRVVQGNIAQHHKWDPKLQFDNLRTYANLSMQPGINDATLVVWPETAVPYILEANSTLATRLGELLPKGAKLLTGALKREGEGDDFEIWNSLFVIEPDGVFSNTYNKHQLVPFGEFVPFRDMLPIDKITPGARDFSKGPGPQTLTLTNGVKISPLICYEAIFPELAVSEHERPTVLVNITNDAWFGNSTGPRQHFHMTRMRAIEQGLPLIRAANTGISAITDGYGRVLWHLDLGQKGVLDGNLTQPLPPTIYARYGKFILLSLLGIAMAAILLFQKRQVRI